MLFKGLADACRRILGKPLVDKKALEEILEELRKILLQNDVESELVDQFVSSVRKKCGKVPAGFTLREWVLKTVYDELVELLGGKPSGLVGKRRIMLVGLFGSGKTLTAAKLARLLKKQGLKPLLVALDFHRPAAPLQLQQLGSKIGVHVLTNQKQNPYEGAKEALLHSKYDSLIFDTSGRNALDQELAQELRKLGEIIKPDEVLLVIPAELGKVARKQAEEFARLVGITGIIVTRFDGTAKGGAALASCQATGAKVKFLGMGESVDDLEAYDAKRFVSRLLGLGDLQTLLEKAKQAEVKPEEAEKLIEAKFTLEDFLQQVEKLRRMGPLQELARLIPGVGMLKIPEEALEKQEQKLAVFKSIIQSMTREERRNPEVISASRIRRIAKGSGRKESEVRELLAQYNLMRKTMRSLGGKAGLVRGPLKEILKRFGF